MKLRAVLAAVALGCAPLALVEAQSGASQPLAIRAERLFLGEGRVLEDGWLLVEGGRIREVGRGVQPPQGALRVEHAGSISAGMVLCSASSGLTGGSVDSVRASTPEARVLDALEPEHALFERLLAGGVTSVLLAPAPTNVVGGVCAVVKTDSAKVLARDSHLALCLSDDALLATRAPTSYSGALALLEASLARPEGTLAQVKAGNLPVLIDAHSRSELQRALDFSARHGLRGVLRGPGLAGELAEPLAASKLSVVLAEIGPGASRRQLDSVVQLAEAGVNFAFALPEAADPIYLRLTAAQCVQVGLEAQVAWDALTQSAARIAGVQQKVGRLERGLDADFVLWSGDPLDLTSRVEAVYVDGNLAWKPARDAGQGDAK